MLLGCDFLRAHKARIDFGNSTLSFPHLPENMDSQSRSCNALFGKLHHGVDTKCDCVDGLSGTNKAKLNKILQKFKGKFNAVGWGAKVPPFEIKTLVDALPAMRPYTYAEQELDFIDKKIEEMKSIGIIRDSTSP